MPRAPTQKMNNASASAGHPYSIAAAAGPSTSAPTSSGAAHSSHVQHPQQYQQNQLSPPHMGALVVQSSDYALQQQQTRHRDDSLGGSSSAQTSPRDSPLVQTQTLRRSDASRDPQRQRLVQEGSTSMKKDPGDPPQAVPNGSTPSTGPTPSSTSSASSTPASGSGTTGAASAATGGTTGKKKHVCSTCDRAFTTSGHLARHARVHTGERNHKCPFPGCETRCSRQDNLQQHYRIHLSPGSRRSSSSATRAAIQRAISNPPTTSAIAVTAGASASALGDLDTPPPLAQATLPAPSLSQAHHAPYPQHHQAYPGAPQTSPLVQSHVPSPHLPQHPYPQTPPIQNGNGHGHMYENGSASGLPGAPDMPQHGYGRSQPESPADHSAPASASPSADASPVIGGPGSTSQSYPGPPPPYVYVQQTGYYQSQQNASPSLTGSSANGSSYAPPPPSSSSSNGQFPPPPQISTFYQQHHYPREAYMNNAPPSSAPAQSQASPNYSTAPLPQQGHDQQRYIDSSRAKTKRRARSSIGSMTNGELSPGDSPVVPNLQAHPNGRVNGQGHSNVYAFYGMATPSSSAGSAAAAPPPHSSGSVASAPPPSAASSRGVGGGHYAVNGNANGFNQFQLHTPPPSAPPPMTTSSSSSGVTTSSNVSYTSNHPSYPPQSINNSGAENGTGTHSPPLVLAPIQTKRMSYHEALPGRYTYSGQNTNHGNNNYPPPTTAYASVGKGYSE